MRIGVGSRALLWVIRGVDVLRCLFAIRGESPCIFIEDFLLSFLDSLLFSLFCARHFFFLSLFLSVISSLFFRLLGSFDIFLPRFFPARHSIERRCLSGPIWKEMLFLLLCFVFWGDSVMIAFWTRDTGFVFLVG